MSTNEELRQRILANLEAIAADVRALDLEGGGGTEIEDDDMTAVAKIRTGEAIQIVPRRNGSWRIDWRAGGKVHVGEEQPSLAGAFAHSKRHPAFPTLPGERPLNAQEQDAVKRLEALGDRGSCSVRFEGARATFADHNWGNPEGVHTRFNGQGLLLEPIEHLERAHG